MMALDTSSLSQAVEALNTLAAMSPPVQSSAFQNLANAMVNLKDVLDNITPQDVGLPADAAGTLTNDGAGNLSWV